MQTGKRGPRNIDEYIAGYPQEVQVLLRKMRTTIRKAAPNAEEIISYQLPAFKQKGNLVYFGAFKNHIGFFPTSSGIAKFSRELEAYEWTKGTVKFPLDKGIPFGLVTKIVKFRVKENLNKAKAGKKG